MLIHRICFVIKRLMDLLPSLELAAKLMREPPAPRKSIQKRAFQVSHPAHPFISQVVDKFPRMDSSLAERLGQANWERHQRIRQTSECSHNDEHETEPVAHSLFHPRSLFQDSGIGSSMPSSSAYAISNASHSSFLSNAQNRDQKALRVPETPAEVALGKPFRCSICAHLLRNIKDRVQYKLAQSLNLMVVFSKQTL